MLMALGPFVFSTETVAFDEIRRRSSWRHPTNSRVGARPAGQFAGPGDDIITLPGTLPHALGDTTSLDQLREMAGEGAAWPLVDGSGAVFGAFVIEDIDETRRALFGDGTPRISDFALTLRRMDDDEGAETSDRAVTSG